MLNTAIVAARKAGDIINFAARNLDRIEVSRKHHNDYVTEVDKACETAIIEILSKAYPDHAFLGEESGESIQKSDYIWIIDPLDGTTNFVHGFPQYAVSIGLSVRGEIQQGVIYDPNRNDLFTASKGRGATLNERRIRVSDRPKLEDCLIGTGFPYRDFSRLEGYMAAFKTLIQHTAGLRRPGAAALDLAYVACGWLDGFFEVGLKPWDIAAGSLMIKEAGGMITDFEGKNGYLETGNVIAGNAKIFDIFLGHIQTGLKQL